MAAALDAQRGSQRRRAVLSLMVIGLAFIESSRFMRW
jgi:hypothetical protein